MRRKGRRIVILVAAIFMLLVLSLGSFAFQNEPDGFRGLEWGDPPESGEDMSHSYELDRDFDITIYKRSNDKMQIGRAKLRDIHYLFYEGRLMAVEIYPNYEPDYDALEDVVVLNFGNGEVTKEYGLTVQILWVGDVATIVLKENFAEGWPILLIYSTEIWEEKEEEFSVKKEKEELELKIKQAEKRIKEIIQELKTLKMKESEIEGPIGGRGVVRWVQPGFPRSAEEQGMMDGKVRVKFWVLPSGEVVEIEIIQTSGVPEFDQDVSEALRKCRFEEIEEEEKQWGIVTFRFEAE